MLWMILTGVLIALTKYLTSLRLRNLRDKIQQDQKDAGDLRQQLFDVSEKEELLKVENGKLMAKATSLHTVLVNLERAQQRNPQIAVNE